MVVTAGDYVHVLFGRRTQAAGSSTIYHTGRAITGGAWSATTSLGAGRTVAATVDPDGNLIAIFGSVGGLVYRVAQDAATNAPPYVWTPQQAFTTSAYERIHHAADPGSPCEADCWFVHTGGDQPALAAFFTTR